MSRDIVCDSKGCKLQPPSTLSTRQPLYGRGGSGFEGVGTQFSNYMIPLYAEKYIAPDSPPHSPKSKRKAASPKKRSIIGKGAVSTASPKPPQTKKPARKPKKCPLCNK
jgi:hypothetical protein